MIVDCVTPDKSFCGVTDFTSNVIPPQVIWWQGVMLKSVGLATRTKKPGLQFILTFSSLQLTSILMSGLEELPRSLLTCFSRFRVWGCMIGGSGLGMCEVNCKLGVLSVGRLTVMNVSLDSFRKYLKTLYPHFVFKISCNSQLLCLLNSCLLAAVFFVPMTTR